MAERARTVLVLERDADAAAELLKVMEAHDYRVVGIAQTVAEARRIAAEQRPDVALLDPRSGAPGGEDLRLAVELERAGIGVVVLAPVLRPQNDTARGSWSEELLLHALDVAFRGRRSVD
jgi:DNA-binding response OmpR family regulator